MSSNDQDIVLAVADYEATHNEQLSFNKGDRLVILSREGDHWWWAKRAGRCGYVPVNHTSASKSQERIKSLLWQDDEYFDNYGKLKLHHEMLSDRPRTLAYLNAMKVHQDCFRDKVVLDVGCGTGVLSMFAAKYGLAKKVFAVEASDMATYAKQLVAANGLSDTVQVINAPVEEADIPEKVDIIISEWMGTLLLFEYMIEAVLSARQLHLKEDGGTMWPGVATLHLCPCNADQVYKERVTFWTEQYGLDLRPLVPLSREEFLSRPIISSVVKPEDCLSDSQEILRIDMAHQDIADLEGFVSPFVFKVTRDRMCHGFVSWFCVEFDSKECNHGAVSLSTGPNDETTHWKQALLLLDEPFYVTTGDEVKGQVKVCRNDLWRRHLSITITFDCMLKAGMSKQSVVFPMKSYDKTFYLWR